MNTSTNNTITAVVVGFTEGTGEAAGTVRSLLLALMPEKGKYQIVTRIGSGLSKKLKQELFEYFLSRVIPSDFIETDSNHVAFRMVKPEKVIEFSVNDVRRETPDGMVRNPVLEIKEGEYRLTELVSGISFVAPVIKSFAEGMQLSEIESIAPSKKEEVEKTPLLHLNRSELLFREVYQKTIGEKLLVLKFTGWKTNKEKTGEWPAYVLHTTNFSSNRQQHLTRDVEITDDYEQLLELRDKAIAENVKKGWIKV